MPGCFEPILLEKNIAPLFIFSESIPPLPPPGKMSGEYQAGGKF